jgi:DNA-binding transcriptional MocR family regulator
MPNVKYFPYDTLEAKVAKADRWEPSPNYPYENELKSKQHHQHQHQPSSPITGAGVDGLLPNPDFEATSARITIPKVLNQPDPSLKLDLSTALQYGTAEGYPPLYSFLRQFTRDVLHPNVPYKGGPEIILTNGNTDGFSKVIDLIIDPWYHGVHAQEHRPGMICEAFVFGNILTQIKPHNVQVVPVELDDEGMLAEGPGGLREVLANWDPKKGRRPHFIYTVT